MAKNIIELEKQLLLLELKKENQVKQLKSDFNDIVEFMKPANIIKRGFNELVGGDKSGISNPLVGGIASFAGTFLLEEFIFKRGGFLYRVLTSVLASSLFQDLTKGEDSFLKKWAIKLKERFKKKGTDDADKDGEIADEETWPESPSAK
jgi:hypothetical protein